MSRKMENIFLYFTHKYFGDKIHYKTCARILSQFRYDRYGLVTEQEAEKIFFDYFLRESPTVNNFLDGANLFQKIFLSFAANSYVNNMDYISSTFNRLKTDEEPEYPSEWIIDAYRSSLNIFKMENRKISYRDQKEMIDTMEKNFIQSTVDNLSLEYDWKICSKVISRFRDRKDSDLLSEEEVEKLCFNAFLWNSPTVRHFLEDANDFQRGFLSCAAKFYGSDADLKYIVLIFNGLKMNENQQFPDEWIIDTYQSSLETLKIHIERIENYPDAVSNESFLKFVNLTIDYFLLNIGAEFGTELINLFYDKHNYQKKSTNDVYRIFLRENGYKIPAAWN
ncbi:uncharacterized protein LOC128395430 [Panonychus citri]|uniref:uncharacterized protein LOC128395430 n=1 Tax=Panonychus citri TaxID=50023 RepID=UPI0023073ACA|nr:uncharacterized protein LOC128395430 [Panonychus citri]